jgi:hypothetical protein
MTEGVLHVASCGIRATGCELRVTGCGQKGHGA